MILLQEDQTYKMKLLHASRRWTIQDIQLHHVTGLAMIGTGMLYHTYNGSIPLVLLNMLGVLGFAIWSVLMVVCGIGLIVRPQHIVIWLMPYLILLLATVAMVVQGDSYTALPYYSQLYIFLLYFTARRNTLPINALQLAGLFQLLVGFTLVFHPNGSGLILLYNSIEPFLFGVLEPEAFYQLMYICTGLILLPRGELKKWQAQVLTMPFLVHGVTFAVISASLGVVAFLPLFFGISIMWLHIGGGEHGV
jgi:hypothetical protein